MRPHSGTDPGVFHREIAFRSNQILDYKRTGSPISEVYQETIDRLMYYEALIRNGGHCGGMR